VNEPVPIVDLFAGSGGLGEGFASCMTGSQQPSFEVRLPIEMDLDAHATLELRSFFRQFPKGAAPDEDYQRLRRSITTEEPFAQHPVQAAHARTEAWLAELRKVPTKELHERIRQAGGGRAVLVAAELMMTISVGTCTVST
jgi:DNA (cytosine-5)-methyltransferase 1